MRFVCLAYCYDQCEVFELLAERVIQIGKVRTALCVTYTSSYCMLVTQWHLLIMPIFTSLLYL